METVHQQIYPEIWKNNKGSPMKFWRTMEHLHLFATPDSPSGDSFLTLSGLQTHKHKKHSIHSPEYELRGGTACPVCLHQFWAKGRLSQHLGYISAAQTANPCNSYMKTFDFQREDMQEQTEELPLNVGTPSGSMDPTYLELILMTKNSERGAPKISKLLLLPTVMDTLFDEDFLELIGIILEENKTAWAEVVENLAEMRMLPCFLPELDTLVMQEWIERAGKTMWGASKVGKMFWNGFMSSWRLLCCYVSRSAAPIDSITKLSQFREEILRPVGGQGRLRDYYMMQMESWIRKWVSQHGQESHWFP